jgi:hypothetical protein
MNMEYDPVPVVVFSGTLWQALMVKSLIESAGIQVFLKDEYNGLIAPWLTSPGGSMAVKVIVADTDREEAVTIVKEYESNIDKQII